MVTKEKIERKGLVIELSNSECETLFVLLRELRAKTLTNTQNELLNKLIDELDFYNNNEKDVVKIYY